MLEGEAIVAWAEQLFRNNPPNMNLRIESDAEIVVKFLTGEVGCNDVKLIEFKRKFVVPYNLKVYIDKWGTQWNCTLPCIICM